MAGSRITTCPEQIAVGRGELSAVLAPLASDTVTTIVGFTESADGQFYNAAAVWHRGAVLDVYRKRHPAINRSIYTPGDSSPVFRVGDLVFGLLICNDSNHPSSLVTWRRAVRRRCSFPNNALTPDRADVVADARRVDATLAAELHVAVIRADVAGREDGLLSYGSTGITAPGGALLQAARAHDPNVVVAEV